MKPADTEVDIREQRALNDESWRASAVECEATVTLVHGTRFALLEALSGSKGSWTDENSNLVAAIRIALRGHAVTSRFAWSGKNSHRARLSASAGLSEHLKALMSAHPAARHYVVAHSHGGNVAMYTLRDPAVGQRLAGVVCIATPFLDLHRRAIDPSLRLVRSVTNTLLWYALAVALVLLAVWSADDRTGALSWPALVVGIVGAVVARWVFKRVQGEAIAWARRRLTSLQDRLFASFALPQAGDTRVLVVRTAGDEAATWLRVVDAVANLPYRLWSPKVLLGFAWLTLFVTMPLSLMMGVLLVYPAMIEEPRGSRSLEFMLGALMFGTLSIAFMMGALVVATVVAQIIMPLWAKLFRGHAVGFGEGNPLENWLIHIAAVAAPPNAGDVTTLAYSVQGAGLRHSQLCTDSRSVTAVAEWLAEDARNPKPASRTAECAGRGGGPNEVPGREAIPQDVGERPARWQARLVRAIGYVVLCIPIVGVAADITIGQIYPNPLPTFVLEARYWLTITKVFPDADPFSSSYFVWIGVEVILGVALLVLAARLNKTGREAAPAGVGNA